jgi:hypothetical protein
MSGTAVVVSGLAALDASVQLVSWREMAKMIIEN